MCYTIYVKKTGKKTGKQMGRPRKERGHRKEFKFWLDPEVIRAVRLSAVVLDLTYPEMVEEALLVGLAFINKARQMGTVGWSDTVRMPRVEDLSGNVVSLEDSDVEPWIEMEKGR